MQIKLRVGCRQSPLARAQTELFLNELQARAKAALSFEIVPLKSRGDREATKPFSEFQEKGIFTDGLRQPLLNGELDLLVHSAKDLSVHDEAAFLRPYVSSRGAPGDVLVSRKPWNLLSLPQGAKVGTGSKRREAQIKRLRADLRVIPIRGSIDTRMARVQKDLDAVVLAAAGLERLGYSKNPPQGYYLTPLSLNEILPAPTQGFLLAEVERRNTKLYDFLKALEDPRDRLVYDAERSLMAGLGANCQAALAVLAYYQAGALRARIYNGQGGVNFIKEADVELLSPKAVEALVQGDTAGADKLCAAVRKALPLVLGAVTLVGAGPGKPELLTLQGKVALEEADVVVFDRLGTSGLKHLFAPHAERIDVGKEVGNHRVTQREIEAILVQKAREGKRVVRLKGGDPFIFGRGGEELLALSVAGIPATVVPGVSAALAVPALSGIPLTHRGLAQGFRVKTGTTAEADSALTEVYLMSVGVLEEVVAEKIAEGFAPSTPAALIQEGGTTTERALFCELDALPQAAREKGIQAPAVLVIGPVVNLAQRLNVKEEPKPLQGQRIWLTRSLSEEAEALRLELKARGADVTLEPLIREVDNPGVDAKSLLLFERFFAYKKQKYILFSSPRAVKKFFFLIKQSKRDWRDFASVLFAVCGPGTKAALQAQGFQADLMPETYDSEALLSLVLREELKEAALLFIRSQKARLILRDELKNKAALFLDVPAYDSEAVLFHGSYMRNLCQNHEAICFFSPSAVRAFCANKALLDELILPKLFAYGKVTAAALEEARLPLAGCALGTKESLIQCLLESLNHERN